MAADLKDMLKRLLASEGKKKFFFAYGIGKRKDDKGDGELAVRGKKPAKAEIVAALAKPGDVFEGVCWLGNRPDNGAAVYFRSTGKALSPATVKLMIKTAKATTTNNYDFQMPSPEELVRGDLLSDGDAAAASEDLSPVAPLGVAPPATPPPAPPAAPSAAAPPASAAPSPSGAEVIKRLNAMTADIMAALRGPNKARVQALFVSVNGQIKNKDFAGAGKALDELGPLVAKQAGAPAAAAGPPAPPRAAAPSPPAAPANNAALAADWERRMIAIEPKVLEAQKTRAAEAKWMTLFMNAQDLGSEGDFAKALVIVDKLEGLLKAPAKVSEAQPAQGAAPGPISNVALQQSLHAWDAARKKTHNELQALERQILELFSDDPRLAEVKQSTRKLDAVLGDYAEELRDWLDEAYNAPVEKKPAICSTALKVLKRYRAYLSKDAFVKAVANNVLQPIDIEGTLGKTLDDVATKLGA